MAGYRQGGFGGNISQVYEQERIGYGPQGYVLVSHFDECTFLSCRFGDYEQETIINRNPYNGATSIVQESEFDPMRGGGYGGNGYGGFGGNISQVNEQERIGYGPQGYVLVFHFDEYTFLSCRFGVYEQETMIKRNPYNGATSIVQENEFEPMRAGGYGNNYGYRY
jgi:hypothetical protein